MTDLTPSKLLTLAEQLRLLTSRGIPEEEAKARLGKAFRLREVVTYKPLRALPYEDAKIDWVTGRVTLRGLSQNPFTPTLTEAEFLSNFLLSTDSPSASTTTQAAIRDGQSDARIAADADQDGAASRDWDDPAWDRPVRLLDAIRLWSPEFGRCLDQVKWAAAEDIRVIARRLESYDHPVGVRARRDRAKRRRRDCDLEMEIVRAPCGDSNDAAIRAFRGRLAILGSDFSANGIDGMMRSGSFTPLSWLRG